MSNLARRLQLQRLLGTAGRTWTARELAARLGVSKLTVARDLDALSGAGVPVVAEEAGQTLKWRLLQGAGGAPPSPAPPAEPHPGILRYPRARRPVRPHVLRALADAQARCRLVRVKYQPRGREDCCELTLAPLALEEISGVAYLRGLLPGSGARGRRTLVGWRIHAVEVLGEGFQPPRRPRRRAFGAVDGKTQAVTVRFAPLIAPYIEERRWHPSERLTRHPDGSLTWRGRVSGMHEVVGWVMSWGARAELLQPAGWREEVARRVRELADAYCPGA